MIYSFKLLRTEAENAELKATRLANKAARRMLNEDEPPTFYPKGHTTRAVIEFRVEHVRRCYDPSFLSDQPPRFLMMHHVSEALNDLQHYIRNWGQELTTQKSGYYRTKAKKVLTHLSERIIPAVEVAEMEFDPRKVLRQSYVNMQSDSLKKIELTSGIVHCTTKKQRDAARQTEITKTKAILQDFHDQLSSWVATLKHGNNLY